jgi:hypothetical protein
VKNRNRLEPVRVFRFLVGVGLSNGFDYYIRKISGWKPRPNVPFGTGGRTFLYHPGVLNVSGWKPDFSIIHHGIGMCLVGNRTFLYHPGVLNVSGWKPDFSLPSRSVEYVWLETGLSSTIQEC